MADGADRADGADLADAAEGAGAPPRDRFTRRAARAAVTAIAMLLTLPAALAALSVHAGLARRAEATRAPAKVRVVSRLPSSDLAFAGGSRHLRFLSLEEPQAAFADGPGLPDPDPAGGLVGVPREAFAGAYTRGATPPRHQPAGRANP